MNIIICIDEQLEENKLFKNAGYNKPIVLINIFGSPIIFYIIDALQLKNEDNLILIYDIKLNKYNFDTIIKNKYDNIHLIKFNKISNFILYDALNILNINLLDKQCILLNSNILYNINILNYCRNNKYNTITSYIQINNLLSIIELNQNIIISKYNKYKISEYVSSIQFYYFNNTRILKYYCNISFNKYKNLTLNKPFILYIIDEMLNDNNSFNINILNIDDFIYLNTPIYINIFCNNILNNKNKKKFCFNLDILLNKYNIDYNLIIKNIEYILFLKKLKHYIIIYSPKQISPNILTNYNITYDELHYNKPLADFYIDNSIFNTNLKTKIKNFIKNIYKKYKIDIDKELGLYIINIPERNFNEIIYDKIDVIIKKSLNNKLYGEIYYYQHIPKKFKSLFPIFINFTIDSYIIEKINGITLSYLYINELISEELLLKYLFILTQFHEYNNNIDDIDIFDNYIVKLKQRYESYDYNIYPNHEYIYNNLIIFFNNYRDSKKYKIGMIHGDPVFTNCILNNNELKFIDMRGVIGNKFTIYGDIFYDLSKVYQSLLGYDEILLNKKINIDYKIKLISIFENFIINTYGFEYINIIKMITNSLFFTLIPLHNDNKCLNYYNLIK
jgi:hypothetical protein